MKNQVVNYLLDRSCGRVGERLTPCSSIWRTDFARRRLKSDGAVPRTPNTPSLEALARRGMRARQRISRLDPQSRRLHHVRMGSSSLEPPSPSRRHLGAWARLLLWAGSTLVALALFLYFALDRRGQALWDEHLAELESAGRTIDPARLFAPAHSGTFWGDAALGAVAENQINLDKRFQEIFATDPNFDEGTYWADLGKVASRFHLDHGNTTPLDRYFPGADLSSKEAAARLLSLLDEFESELTDFRSALRGDPSSSLLEGQEPQIPEIEPFTASIRFNRASNLRMVCLLEVGRVEEALAEIEDLLRLSAHLRFDGLLVNDAVATSVANSTLRSIHRSLDRSVWTPEQLDALGCLLADAIPDRSEFDRILQREFSFLETFFSKHLERRGKRDETGYYAYDIPESIRRPGWLPGRALDALGTADVLVWQYLPYGAFRMSTIELHRWAFGALLDPEIPLAERVDDLGPLADFDGERWFRNPANDLILAIATTCGRCLRQHEESRTLLEMARVAAAAERHRLETGRNPMNWDEIVPRWLAEIPDDPWTEGRLRYRLDRGGRPIIYSVGGNGTDEGGIPTRSWKEGDLVWRYSTATGTENP